MFHVHFLLSTGVHHSLLLATAWIKQTAQPLAQKPAACTTCYFSAAVLALEAELRMQPWLQTTVESEKWTTEIKAICLYIQTTQPILGTDSSYISNIQHQQSSQIPPHSYLNPQLTNFMFVKEQGKNQINCNLYKVGNPRMQPAEPAWGWVHTMQQSLKYLQADRSQQSRARGEEKVKRQMGETCKCQIQNPRDPFQQ